MRVDVRLLSCHRDAGGEQQCRIDFAAAWNILPWLPLAKPLFRYFANIFMKQDKQAMERQAVGLKYKPALMLIDDADTPPSGTTN